MDWKTFCGGIGLSREAEACAASFGLSQQEYERYRRLFWQDPGEFIRQVEERGDWAQAFLCLFIRFGLDAWPAYRRRGISERVYLDTFRDIAIWEEEYRLRFGVPGIATYGWLCLHPQLKLFRLGRLQFQPSALPEAVSLPEMALAAGDLVLNVHIPKDGPLRPEECAESYRQAEAFFRGIPPVFVCESWLLGPELPRLLRPDSNILAFQKEYRLLACDGESRQAEERIFGQVLEDPGLYPEQTGLQRAAKRFLRDGGKLGSGRGIRVVCETEKESAT